MPTVFQRFSLWDLSASCKKFSEAPAVPIHQSCFYSLPFSQRSLSVYRLPFTFNSNRSIKNLATALTSGKIICLLVAGGTLAFANLINLYLVGVLPSALLFPAQNGGSTLLSVLIAAAIFKERPDGRQKIALISSLCGLAILFI